MKTKIAVPLFLSFLLLLNACGNSALGQLALVSPAAASDYKAGNVSEYFQQSFTYESQKNYNAALDSDLKILQIEPTNYTATLRAGWLNYLKGSYKNSIRYYQKAVSLVPNAIEPRLGLTLPMMALKRWRDVEAQALKVLRVDPENYYATSRLAFSLFSQKRYAEAERRYRTLVSFYPSDTEMKLGLAWTLLYMGKKREAHVYFEEVLKVWPNNKSALDGMRAF